MKKIILFMLFVSGIAISPNSVLAQQEPKYVTPPINPFDSNGYCFHVNCPPLYLGAKIEGVVSIPRWPMNGPVPTEIPLIMIFIDNKGYSNWWQANAFLVSENGTRLNLGKGESDDGNKYEKINVKCTPDFDLNPCSPSISWSRIQLPQNTPIGYYALEVQFFLYDGRSDATYTFGPDFMKVTGQVRTETLDNKSCKIAGKKINKEGIRYACIKSGKKLIWQRLS